MLKGIDVADYIIRKKPPRIPHCELDDVVKTGLKSGFEGVGGFGPS
jgi:hypothetical protein